MDHVTVKEIIRELKSIRDALDWRITPQQRIQGILKNDPEGRVFDPITAVAFFRTGKFFPEGHSGAAARAVGLSFGDSAGIVAACNYGCAADAVLGALRRDLTEAVFAGTRLQKGTSPVIAERTVITH